MATVDPAAGSPARPVPPSASTNGGDVTERNVGQQLSRSGMGRCLGVMLFMGLLSGVVGGFLIDRTHELFEHPAAFMAEMKSKGRNPPPEFVERYIAANQVLRHKNTALTVGLLGLIFCGFVGLGRGILERSGRTALLVMAGGALLGLVLGALGGLAESLLEVRLDEYRQLDRMIKGMIKHAVIWGFVGVAVGLTAVLPARQFKRMTSVAFPTIAAGIVAALVFVPISSIVFPNLSAELAVPPGLGNRILWASLPAVLMSMVVGRALATREH